jgi:hypothetical protein
VGAADFVGVGTGFAVGVAVGVGVSVGVGVGVGLGVGVAATTSGDGTDVGELATSELVATLTAGLAGLALPATTLDALVAVACEPCADVDPADDGWLLVHAARAPTQRTATTQRAGVGPVVRSRLAIEPG